MASTDQYNMIQMLNRDLERSIKIASVDAISKKMVAEFEKEIRPLIKDEVEKMTFHGIDQMQDVLHIREEFRLYIQWSDEDEAHIKES